MVPPSAKSTTRRERAALRPNKPSNLPQRRKLTQHQAQPTWPLFGSATAQPDKLTADQQKAVLNLITDRVDGSCGADLEFRISETYDSIEWWKSVGCELCFVMEGQKKAHSMDVCLHWNASDKARSILAWLQSLDIPRFSDGNGACSMCTNSWHPCGDISISDAIRSSDSSASREYWRKEMRSSSGNDGHCERKPIMRTVIAALCAYDEQFIGMVLAKRALDQDGVDISTEPAARAWFEQRVPFRESWIPRLMFVFETVVCAFYTRQNYHLGRPPLEGLPRYPPGARQNHKPWKWHPELRNWLTAVEWWRDKCSYCVGLGRRGSEVTHQLWGCSLGGRSALKSDLAKAVNEARASPGACYECHLPKYICDKWVEEDYRWEEHKETYLHPCQYGRHLLRHIIIGLCSGPDKRFWKAAFENARRCPLCVADADDQSSDSTRIAECLRTRIRVAGVDGTEMMRHAATCTLMVWHGISAEQASAYWSRTTPSAHSCLTLEPRFSLPSSSKLRDSPHMDLDVTSSVASLAVQEMRLIHRKLPQPIDTWDDKDMREWDWKLSWAYPNPTLWRHWSDDNTWRSWEWFDEGTIRQQLRRWSVRCPLCLLHRSAQCDDHRLSSCPMSGAPRACEIRRHLQDGLRQLGADGIKGYGSVPWCSLCCLPRSCCPSWKRRKDDVGCGDGCDLEWTKEDSRGWRRLDGSNCVFRDVIVDATSAMLSFHFTEKETFADQVEAWRDGSHIRFNKNWGLWGWLLSPMPWGKRDVMVLTKVFCKLDVAVEDMWIDECVEDQRRMLGTPSSEQRFARRGRSGQQAPEKPQTVERQREEIRRALDYAESVSERMSGIFESDTTDVIQTRIKALYRDGIRCQLCMQHAWSEHCYLHDMAQCGLWAEGNAAKGLLAKWTGLCAGEKGKQGRCANCGFPAAVCCVGDAGDSDGGMPCAGPRVVLQAVAVLLTVADGVLGELIVEEQMQPWNTRNSKGFEKMSPKWLAEARGDGVPRIAHMFVRLLEGLNGLRAAGWQ